MMICWKGDHSPRHIHDYRDGKLVVKWDIEHQMAMKSQVNRRLRRLLADMESEGLL